MYFILVNVPCIQWSVFFWKNSYVKNSIFYSFCILPKCHLCPQLQLLLELTLPWSPSAYSQLCFLLHLRSLLHLSRITYLVCMPPHKPQLPFLYSTYGIVSYLMVIKFISFCLVNIFHVYCLNTTTATLNCLRFTFFFPFRLLKEIPDFSDIVLHFGHTLCCYHSHQNLCSQERSPDCSSQSTGCFSFLLFGEI